MKLPMNAKRLSSQEKNVVLMSLEQYNKIMKAFRNFEYLSKIEQGIAQLESGKDHVHKMIETDDYE